MRAIALVLAGLLPCGIACAQAPTRAEEVGMSTARLERARTVLKSAVDERVAGSTVGLIARDGKVVLHEAFGERAPGAPIPRDAIARLASITKTVTAVAVLMLHEEGRLRLNDPVARFIPEFADVKVETGDVGSFVPPTRAVTVHDLLTHQAGLAASGEAADGLWSRARTVGEFATLTAAIPLRSQPGSQYEYGPAYEVLAAIVEKASGVTFARFVQQRILAPLRMHDTYFFVPREKAHRMADMYRKQADGRLAPSPPADPNEPAGTFTSGGGGLVGTVADYHRFTQMLLNGGELDGQRLLGPKTVALLATAHVDAARYGSESGDYGWGLGTRVRTRVTAGGLGSVGAFGWNGGSGTLYLVDPQERLVVIVFAPSVPRTPGIWGDADLRNDFVTAAYQAIVESHADR